MDYEGRFIGQVRLIVNNYGCRGRYIIGLFDTSTLGKGLGTRNEISKGNESTKYYGSRIYFTSN